MALRFTQYKLFNICNKDILQCEQKVLNVYNNRDYQRWVQQYKKQVRIMQNPDYNEIIQFLLETSIEQILKYPQLQKRINSKQFQISAIHKMITSLRTQSIQKLKKQFVACNNSVTIQQFVWLMANCFQFQNFDLPEKSYFQIFTTSIPEAKPISKKQLKKYELNYQLIKIFEDIDIDESASITWQQFIEYITCISLTQIQNIGNDTERQNNPINKGENISQKQIQFAHDQQTLFRKNSIKKIIQLQRHNKLAIIQKKIGNLTFTNLNGNICSDNVLQLTNVDYSKVLSIDYSDDDRIFGILMNNHRVVFVEDGQMQKYHGQNKFSGDQIQIMYLKIHKLWLLVCMDQSIHIFTPPKGRSQATHQHKLLLSFVPHEGQKTTSIKNQKKGASIIGIKQSINPLGLYTGSINGQIKIWSLQKNKLLSKLCPCNQQTTKTINPALKGFQIFNQKTVSYMICWIFTNQISVWLPSSSLSKAYLGKLKGHMGIVQDAKFLNNFPHVISIDNKCTVRLWNIRKFQCIQSWRTQHPCQIMVLKSLPYAILYDKLMGYYKIRCEEQFQLIQKKNSTKITISHQQINNKQIEYKQMLKQQKMPIIKKKHKKVVFQSNQKQIQRKDDHKMIYHRIDSINQKQANNQHETNQIPQIQSTIIQILYDDYFDCLLILSEDQLKEISINSGKIMNKIQPTQKNQVFLSMCIKNHRRVFIANNLGEIALHKVDDGTKLLTINILQQSVDFRKQNGIFNEQLEVYAIDYNTHNEVLLIVALQHSQSMIIAYGPDISRKKQIFYDQQNICSFASAANYNLFYVASNNPQIITIWDYHNIIPLKTIQNPNSIRSISAQTNYQNLLMITEQNGIRIYRLNGVQPRNSVIVYRQIGQLITNQLYLQGNSQQKFSMCQLVCYEKQIKHRKVKVTFNDNNKCENLNEKPTKSKQVVGLYVQTLNKLIFIELNNHLDFGDKVQSPKKSTNPNIIKQQKYYEIQMTNYNSICHNRQQVPCQPLITQSISNIKQKMCKMGHIKQMIYFSMIGNDKKSTLNSSGVLNFYDYKKSFVKGKISLPTGQLIFWNICITLSDKVFKRMLEAEKIASNIKYKSLVNNAGEQQRLNLIRKIFLMERYLSKQDIDIFKQLKSNTKTSNKSNSVLFQSQASFQYNSQSTTSMHDKTSLMLAQVMQQLKEKQQKEKTIQQFHQKRKKTSIFTNKTNQPIKQMKKRKSASLQLSQHKNKKSTTHNKVDHEQIKYKQKMQEISKKYSRVFQYLENKKQKQVCSNLQGSQKKVSSLMGSSNSFKVQFRSNTKSISKMYTSQTKLVKQCINKLSKLDPKFQTNLTHIFQPKNMASNKLKL